MSSGSQDVKPMVARYKKIFVVLSIITLMGIAIAFMHLPWWFMLIVGMTFIFSKSVVVYESFKKFMVGRNLIVILFLLTIIFVMGLLILPFFNHSNYIVGTEDISKQLLVEQKLEGKHGH